MNIMTRRNAVVGYLALRALRHARRNATVGYLAAQGMEHTRARRSNRRALKIALYVALAAVSLGVLAAATGFAAKRKRRAAPLEATGAEGSSAAEASDAVAEGVPAATEPVAAT